MPQVAHRNGWGACLFPYLFDTFWPVAGSVCSHLLFPAPCTEGKCCLTGILQPWLGELFGTATTPAFTCLSVGFLSSVPGPLCLFPWICENWLRGFIRVAWDLCCRTSNCTSAECQGKKRREELAQSKTALGWGAPRVTDQMLKACAPFKLKQAECTVGKQDIFS